MDSWTITEKYGIHPGTAFKKAKPVIIALNGEMREAESDAKEAAA